jgi:hypothetical protein
MNLPAAVIDAKDAANDAADAHHVAWEELQGIKDPTHVDVEKWIAVRAKFHAAQETFERLLLQALGR